MNQQEIEKWLDKYNIKNYTIQPDGVVDVNGDIDLNGFTEESILVQFGTVTGSFDLGQATAITSFKGAPRIVGEHCYCDTSTMSSLEGIPKSIGGDVSFFKTNIKSLSGIDKLVNQIDGMVYLDENTSHILGLLRIKGIKSIDVDFGGKLDEIMNRHIKTGDLITAQDELIDAGFIEQAKL